MNRFAASIVDLDYAWKSPAGAALVEATVEDQEGEDAEVVSVGGQDALVLSGPTPRVAALVAGLVRTPMPGPRPRTVRVYAEGPRGWYPIDEAPPVPELPDEAPVFEDEEDRP